MTLTLIFGRREEKITQQNEIDVKTAIRRLIFFLSLMRINRNMIRQKNMDHSFFNCEHDTVMMTALMHSSLCIPYHGILVKRACVFDAKNDTLIGNEHRSVFLRFKIAFLAIYT